MISQDIKKQVINQTDIVDVVGEVVKLSKKGNSYFGLCPFHNDNNPSMSVNREKRIFNCFSCNTKGNVIYFMMRYHNISEDQATINLAKRLGMTISDTISKEAIKEERLIKVMDEATNFYQYYLNNTEEGLKAKQYLSNRGINQDIIKTLKIGLASKEINYLNLALKQKNISQLDQIELGLIKDNNNTITDVFRNRIMFPIENKNGQIVGFSGRIYDDSKQAKYINSSENYIFHKGQILYNYHHAINEIRKNDKVIIYEGFMDVIASMKAGINYCVATMGTALTQDHIKMLLSLTKNIILCFDGDSAGIHAMKRSAEMFAKYNIIPKAIVLPNNMDPDEYLKAYGVEQLNKYYLENEKLVYDWLFALALKNFIRGDLESTENFKKEVFSFISFSKQNTIIEHYLKRLSEEIDTSFDALKSDFGNPSFVTYEVVEPIQKKETKIINKPFKIKRKVYFAYDKIILHLINSKSKYLDFIHKFGDDLYLDASLSLYFDIIKKIELFYAENEIMDNQDFLMICRNLDNAYNTQNYLDYANNLLSKTLVNLKDNDEFEQCLKTLRDCYNDLYSIRKRNDAQQSLDINDIQNFEKIKKNSVKIISKED